MLKNYLKIALRHLRKHPGYTFINVAGLAVGIACCLLILLYVQAELRVDRFHTNAERLYRLNKVVTPKAGETEFHVITSGPMAPALAADYPEVEQAIRVLPWFDDVLMRHGETSVLVPDVVFVDSNFFDVFSFELVRGDPADVLAAPLSIVLTETTAHRLFGDTDPIGQLLTGLNDLDYTVTGVAADPPVSSHLRFNALVAWSSLLPGQGGLEFGWIARWFPQVLYTYLQLTPGADPATLEAKLPEFMQRHFPQRADQYRLYLQPFTDLYLDSAHLLHMRNLRVGNRTYVYAFAIIALFILLIACINFMNLTTARATKRAQEVGMRKVLGAARRQLIRQFLGESLMMSLVALLLAVALVEVVLPVFQAFTGQVVPSGVWDNPTAMTAMVILFLVIGVAAGAYPAFVLSSFRPMHMLKGLGASSRDSAGPRKVLVTLQFTISIVLLAGTAVVYQQMAYMQTKNLGFQKEQVVILPIGNTAIQSQFDAFKQTLLQHPNITHAAGSNSVPGGGLMSFGINPEGKEQDESWTAQAIRLDDYDLLETYGMEIATGRYFSEDRPTDATNGVVINEAMARSLGWNDPLGKRLDAPGEVDEGTVIGVIKDFHFESLHQPVAPLFLYYAPRHGNLSLRLTGQDLPATLAFIRDTWERFDPAYPFDYAFLDQAVAQLYDSEQRLMQTLSLFAILAILIACLGLFGLASFTAEQRTKEIGVRKVLGASVGSLVLLLSKDFTRLIGIAFVLASPLAYLAAQQWLQDFAYRIDLSWPIFLLAGALALAIAFFTVSYQAIRAAVGDPVKALRYE